MELETSRVLQPDFVAGLLIPEESSSTHIYEDEEIYHVMQLPIADEMLLDIQSLDEDKIHHLKLPEMQNKLIVLDIYQGSMYMLNAFTKVYLDLLPIYIIYIIY
ncbi:hypothetical protein S245_056605 [Arachis hypogaea]